MTQNTTTLALEEDARNLAFLMTAAFSASDVAYPLIWGPKAPPGAHNLLAWKGLFTPVQREDRVTFKAMKNGRLVGFASWTLPDPNTPKKKVQEEKEGEPKPRELPEIPGVNLVLWNEKLRGPTKTSARYIDHSKDFSISLLSYFIFFRMKSGSLISCSIRFLFRSP